MGGSDCPPPGSSNQLLCLLLPPREIKRGQSPLGVSGRGGIQRRLCYFCFSELAIATGRVHWGGTVRRPGQPPFWPWPLARTVSILLGRPSARSLSKYDPSRTGRSQILYRQAARATRGRGKVDVAEAGTLAEG
jgi:hypothetical protein